MKDLKLKKETLINEVEAISPLDLRDDWLTYADETQAQTELIEKLEKAISEHMGYLASATGVPPQYVGLKSALYAVEAWRAGKEQK